LELELELGVEVEDEDEEVDVEEIVEPGRLFPFIDVEDLKLSE
jgi:hypothetical protein